MRRKRYKKGQKDAHENSTEMESVIKNSFVDWESCVPVVAVGSGQCFLSVPILKLKSLLSCHQSK